MEWSERIGRRIRLRDLHFLLAVVQFKSMAKAAQHLAVSKPVISKVIADLERVLGVRLLDRNRHGAEPTIYGAALLKRGTAVFEELREGVKDIEFLVDPAAGEVRIGSSTILAASFVSAVVDRLSRRHPRIVFHLVPTQTDSLSRELNERNVDLLIAQKSSVAGIEGFDFELLYDDSNVVVAGRQNPWAQRRGIVLADLINESWVLPPPQRALGALYLEAFRAYRLDYPSATVFTTSPEARISLVSTGRFLSIVPTAALRFPTRRSDIKVLPVKLPIARIPFGIVTLKDRTVSPTARLFIEQAREVANPQANKKR
jgi:DNA-binding transcriptional LysR family regulator